MDKELQCQLLLYLDSKQYLHQVKTACKLFLDNLSKKQSVCILPWRYEVEIDVIDLIDVFPALGEMLLKDPIHWKKLCTDILFACLQHSILHIDHRVEYNQVTLILRFKCLPLFFIRRNQHYFNGLELFQGIVTGISKPSPYVYHTVWICPEDCEASEVILHCTPKHPPKCATCRSNLFENTGMRRCGEKIIVTLVLKKELLPKKFFIVDDLISKVKLGGRYIFGGVIVKKKTHIWAVEEENILKEPLTQPIPTDIEELYTQCQGKCWKFIYCLASTLGVNVCPIECFMHLKISLLMSLASVKANACTGSAIMHVFVAGSDTSFVGKIMTDAAILSDRNLLFSTSTSTSTALVATAGGVCVMSLPFHTYTQKQISGILTAIESNEIMHVCGTAKLQTSVWAQGADHKKMFLFNVASVFGYVCRGDYDQHSDQIAEFMLQSSIESVTDNTEVMKTYRDLKVYLDLVAGLRISLDKEAETLLHKYFLAARHERPRGVTVGSMNALVATSITSARLCRRSVVNVDDAVFAIWLHVSGSSEPRFAPEEYLQTPSNVNKLQKVMKKFAEWLTQFIGININY